ncbi:LytTr DNA-binding domain-containing protein [Mariniphaga anaerophila]|uniref:LytTr DNA-binding domain-containing protein n=1 Tax=Mariniphaga anaerophila TaxID=1484053 RepID=A0A1M5DE52_9BACT|nr:LytTR family DNA-binding domain-containing protein [Mariniphaga anaerophila]SHF65358.1 LytTr DNA-binding domain-containing protein [Mariniphaga anaerophila]
MHRILLHTSDSIHLIPKSDILYCKSTNSYTTFYFVNRQPIVVSRNIKEFEQQLIPFNFFRPHQSFLVNLEHLVKIDKAHGYFLILKNNIQVPTSSRKKKELIQILHSQLQIQTETKRIQI